MNTFTLAGKSLDAKNNPAYAGQYMVFRITSVGADVEDGASYPRESVDVLIAADGTWTVDLWVNGDSGVECLYEVLEPSGQRIEFIFPSVVEATTVRYEFAIENYLASASAAQQTPGLATHIADLNNPHVVTATQTAFTPSGNTSSDTVQLAIQEVQTDVDSRQLQLAEGAFVDGDKTKLDGIEALANVNDPTTVLDADIGVTVQAYDAETSKYDDTTANFTGTLQEAGSNVLAESDYSDIPVPSAQVVKSIQVGSSSDKLSIPDDPTVDIGLSDYSIVAWVKFPSSVSSRDHGILNKFAGTGYSLYFSSGGTLVTYIGGSYFSTSVQTFLDDRWHCIALTFDRSADLTYYVDGVAIDTDDITSKTGANLDNGGSLDFLNGLAGGPYGMTDGYVANYIALTKDVLTAAEVKTISINPHYVLELDNLAVCLEVPAQGSFIDRSANAATVSLTGTIDYLGYGPNAVVDTDIGVTVQAYSAILDATTASYTTAEETKLAGIEALADVTDATNVAASGGYVAGGTDVPITDGGTGASTAAAALTNLGVISSTATLDFPSIASNAVAVLTMTVTGASIGDTVMLGAPSTIEADLTWTGFVSAADTVSIRMHHSSGSAIDPASATWRATVVKY